MIAKKLLAFSFSLLALSGSVLAQESTEVVTVSPVKKYARPDIPGTFLLELGLNRVTNQAEKFDLGLWGSRTLNVYYQYDMRILKSKFTFVPGVGFGFDRYKFKNNYILTNDNNNVDAMIEPGRYQINNTTNLNVKKSQLITNYLDVPLELKFSTNPEDPGRSFKVSVGGRVGYLLNSHTKVKYSGNGETKKEKDKESFNLNPFRYGVFLKIGAGNFSLFGYYNLSPLFKAGKDPIYQQVKDTKMQNFTIGISLSSF